MKIKQVINEIDKSIDKLTYPSEYILFVNYDIYLSLINLDHISMVEEHVGSMVIIYHKYKHKINIKYYDFDIEKGFEFVPKFAWK